MVDPLVKAWAASLSTPAPLTLHTTGTPESDEMNRLGQDLALQAGRALAFTTQKGEGPLPFFETDRGLRFFTLPGNKMRELLLYAAQGTPDALPPKLLPLLKRLDLPATLDLFVAELCPFCPLIARQLITLALHTPQIRLSLFDGTLFPEEAEKREVLSAPTLIYDADVRWSGQFDVASAMEVIAGRTPQELSAEAIRALLEEGGAERVTAMVADAGKPFASLTALLAHETWSVRLGAMVVMETLAETHPDIVSLTAGTLLASHPSLPPSALGDILYIAGLSGDSAHLSILRTILATTHDTALQEAAEEAIEALEGKPPR